MFIIINSENDKTFKVTYYDGGDKLFEKAVPSGTSLATFEYTGEGGDIGRFVGWNTKPDMSGKMFLRGTQVVVDRDISLYAMVVGSGVFVVVFPDEQKGFSITADPMIVPKGGSSILSYSLWPSHIDDGLVIAVNGNPMKLDAMKRIHLADITEDQTVTVAGVFDRREHSISLPDEQRGYVLTSSAEKVHHGESYTLEYSLLPGYKETYDFGIHVNGVDSKTPSDGVLRIENVMDNHRIAVTGVEPIEYSMFTGKNISVTVNGASASRATVEDTVNVIPGEGYAIPSTFNAQIKGEFTADDEGYHIASNMVFPSVLKITAGNNVKIDGYGSDAIFLCPNDKIKAVPAYGYSLPGNYVEKATSLNGVKYSAEKFSFSDDTVLPSIYMVVFSGHNKIHATFYVVGGTMVPLPQSNPERIGYYFTKWNADLSLSVASDQLINPIWDPMTHDVCFGPNLFIKIGDKGYFSDGENSAQSITIKVKSNEKVSIESVFGLHLPEDYGPQGVAYYKDGYYEILGGCSFPGITFIKYVELEGSKYSTYSAIIGEKNTLIPEPTVCKEGYIFTGWTYEGKYVGSQMMIENKAYILHASWKLDDG